MTASQKLKVLVDDYEDAVGYTTCWNESQPILEALPQIVAVIEAAEGCTDWHRPERNFIELTTALAALEEKLP